MPSSRSYSIIEPHPTVNPSYLVPTGRGGAGNHTRVPASVTRGSDASGPASHFSHISHPSSTSSTSSSGSSKGAFMTGRGGAGNIRHQPSERAIFSFDEELARQLSQDRHAAPVYHVGRGGAGNVHRLPEEYRGQFERRVSDDSVSAKSDLSLRSAESGADIVTGGFKKGWKKIVGAH